MPLEMKALRSALVVGAMLLAALNSPVARSSDANWPRFLGPGSRALATNADLPDRWSATENVAWKAEISGRGWSSPIAWGQRVFLTTVVGKSDSKPQKWTYRGKYSDGPPSEHQWKVLCMDLLSGKMLWERLVHQGVPPSPTHSKNSYASETPVADGNRVYAYFGNVGVFCLDFDGRPVWSKLLAPQAMRGGWGTGASPVLHRDRLYLVNDNEEHSYLLALDKCTGKEVWRVDRDEKTNWATPYVWENQQRTEIVTAGTGKVRAYDLNGKLLWWLQGMSSYTIATPYSDRGLLYISSGSVPDKLRPVYAIRPGATGEISLGPDQTSNAAIAWSQPMAAPFGTTTLVYDGRLYVLYDGGLLSAFNSQTGAPRFERQRLPKGKTFTASPWAYNGWIFCLNEDGVTFVVRAGDQFEVLRTNRLADDDMCLATPAMIGDRLLIRTSSRLYCVRKGPSAQRRSSGLHHLCHMLQSICAECAATRKCAAGAVSRDPAN
jgi:outer membrane protein assembly factor BamB